MNILFLYTSPWWNAAAYYAVSLIKGLQSADYNVIWGGDARTPAYKEANIAGVHTVHIPFSSLLPGNIIRSVTAIHRICNKYSIQVINCHSPQAVSLHI